MTGSTVSIPKAYRLTYSDWSGIAEESRIYEIIEGELLLSPPPSVRHQQILSRLLAALHRHLEEGRLGEVFAAPIAVRFSDDTVLEPDLVVVLAEHRARIGLQHIEAPADLVIEILSPGTAGRDLRDKRGVYGRAGIPEYWIVDPQAGTVRVLALSDGAYVDANAGSEAEELRSRILPALRLPLRSIFPAT